MSAAAQDGRDRVGGGMSTVAWFLTVGVWGWGAAVLAGNIAESVFAFGGEGSGWTNVTAFVVAIVLLLPALFGLAARPAAAVSGLLLGVVLGTWVFSQEIGTRVSLAWTAPADKPGGIRAVGDWMVGDLVIRARPDVVVAYRVGEGRVVWRWSPPDRELVCAMSRQTASGIGLIGYTAGDTENSPCHGVAALDLSTGRPRWTTSARGAPDDSLLHSDAAVGLLSVAQHLAVFQDGNGWRAVTLSTGRPLWRAAARRSCRPARVAAAADRVVTVAECDAAAPVLQSLSVSDGREQWRVTLPARGAPDDLALLSAAPATVLISESSPRGTHAVVSYDATGRPGAPIPLTGTTGDLAIPLGEADEPASFAARPAYGAVVTGGLLITSAMRPGDIRVSNNGRQGIVRRAKGRLVAFSLTDGTLRWTARLDDHLDGIALDGETVWALSYSTLTRVATATGRRVAVIAVHGTRQLNAADLWRTAGGFAIVAEDGTESATVEDAPVRFLH